MLSLPLPHLGRPVDVIVLLSGALGCLKKILAPIKRRFAIIATTVSNWMIVALQFTPKSCSANAQFFRR